MKMLALKIRPREGFRPQLRSLLWPLRTNLWIQVILEESFLYRSFIAARRELVLLPLPGEMPYLQSTRDPHPFYRDLSVLEASLCIAHNRRPYVRARTHREAFPRKRPFDAAG